MFDDFILRKTNKSPIHQIFQKLPHLRPHSKPIAQNKAIYTQIKENFSELTVLNQIPLPLSKAPQFSFTHRHVNCMLHNTNIKSVSFINFSEALSTVARISRLEDQTEASYRFKKKLLQSNQIQKNPVTVRTNSANKGGAQSPFVKRRAVSIFNYPNLKINDVIKFEKHYEEKKINFVKACFEEKTKEKPSILEKPNIIEKKIREKSFFDEKEGSSNANAKISLEFERSKSTKNSLRTIITKKNKENEIIISKKNKENEITKKNKENEGKLFEKVREKIFRKTMSLGNQQKDSIHLKIKEKEKPFRKEIIIEEEDKGLLEPWKIQDTLPEEIA